LGAVVNEGILIMWDRWGPREGNSWREWEMGKCNRNSWMGVVPDEEGKTPFEEESMEIMYAFASVIIVCLFTFLSVAIFAVSRRKEREAYYRSESLRRISETPETAAATVLEMMREEQRLKERNSRERTKVGGLINIAVGLGLSIFLFSVGGRESPYLCGLIPLFIGIAMLFYALKLAPKEG